jgi:hypothetical protein
MEFVNDYIQDIEMKSIQGIPLHNCREQPNSLDGVVDKFVGKSDTIFPGFSVCKLTA